MEWIVDTSNPTPKFHKRGHWSLEFCDMLPLGLPVILLISTAGTTKNFNMFPLYYDNISLPTNTDVFKKFRKGCFTFSEKKWDDDCNHQLTNGISVYQSCSCDTDSTISHLFQIFFVPSTWSIFINVLHVLKNVYFLLTGFRGLYIHSFIHEIFNIYFLPLF